MIKNIVRLKPSTGAADGSMKLLTMEKKTVRTEVYINNERYDIIVLTDNKDRSITSMHSTV